MYINPPVENLKELQERIESGETFKVFKRWVNERNRDRSFKRDGWSRVTLADGMDITVEIFRGAIKNAVETKVPKVQVQIQTRPAPKKESFSSLIASMNAMIKEEYPTKDEENGV